MKGWSAKFILTILFVISLIFVCGCSGISPTPVSNSLPSDKFVAIYEEYHDEGTIIEGTGNIAYFPVPCPVPMPYDNNLINDYARQFQSDKNFKIFYSTYYFRYYPYSGYTTASYRVIDVYPYTIESNLTILDIDRNGTINASYMNQSVILKVGDKWQSPVVTSVENKSLEVGKLFSGVYKPFVLQYNKSWTVENKGLFNKSKATSSSSL